MAYFVAPNGRARRRATPSNYAMSSPVVRARAQRGLVHGRQLRLLRRQARRLAVRGGRGGRGGGRLHRRRRASARCRRRRGEGRAAELHAAAQRRGEDRGLPGLPGPAHRRASAAWRASAARRHLERPRAGRLLLRALHDGRPKRRAADRAAQAQRALHARRAPLPPRRLRAAALLQARAARVRRAPAHAAAGRLPAHARRAGDADRRARQARGGAADREPRRPAATFRLALAPRPCAASTACGSWSRRRASGWPRRSPRGASRWYYGHTDQN